jgi:VanZ family protein
LSARLKFWLPAILLAILISVFSTRYFSAEQTARFIFPLLHWLFPSAGRRALRFAHFLIRKLAHITEFAAFSVAVFHGVRGPRAGWKFRWAVWTLMIAVCYAGLDEWHQSFVPMREPRVRDVLIDGLGALLAQLAVWVYALYRRSPADSTPLREEIVETITK